MKVTVNKGDLTPELEDMQQFELITLDQEVARRCVNATPKRAPTVEGRKGVTTSEIMNTVRMYLSGMTTAEIEQQTGRSNSAINKFLSFTLGRRTLLSWPTQMHNYNRTSNLMGEPLKTIAYFKDAVD